MTAVNAEGATNARSAPTAVVPPNAGPQNQQRPSIEGEAKAGEELALDAGHVGSRRDLVRVPVAAV